MSEGYFCLVLHAHLPFVRHPEYESFLEENWLFEAISECYLPLLRVFNRLKDDYVPFRITLSISPTLASMLTDELLQKRYIAHVKKMQELAAKELDRTKRDSQFKPIVQMYKDLLDENLFDFTEIYKKNILKGFKALEKDGYLEIITSAATHAFLPLFEEYPKAVEAQINTAVISHGRLFGKEPSGFWLPECGYFSGLEKYLKVNNQKYSFTAAHGVLFSSCGPQFGVYSPLTSNGVSFFGRDLQSSSAVWSGQDGYPGDQVYRDFYRDIGFDLPLDYIRPYIHDGDIRVFTGFKYYAITGKSEQKRPYDPSAAREKVKEHAENFLYNRVKQAKRLSKLMNKPPIIVSPYDAELFGHWWFEGPLWLEHLLRAFSAQDELKMISPPEYLDMYPDNQIGQPSFSSWGNRGYAEVWLDAKNDWIYRHIHKAIERMMELATRFPDEKGLKRRTLNQAAREVMLAMASDWPFIMKNGTTVPYAVRRVKEHLHNFNRIYENLCRNTVNTEWLTSLEKKNNLFPDLDYSIFSEQGR